MSSGVIIIALRGPNRVTKFAQSEELDIDLYLHFDTRNMVIEYTM